MTARAAPAAASLTVESDDDLTAMPAESRPWWHRRPRLSFFPTRRLALLVLVSAPAWMLSGSETGLGVALGALVMLFALVLADLVLAPAHRAVELARALPRTVGVGDEAAGRYELRSRWPRALRVTVHDQLPAAILRTGGWTRAVRLDAGDEATLDFSVTGRTRGVHALGPVVLEVTGPLGLVRRVLRHRPTDEITVAPSVSAVRRFRLLALQHRLQQAGVRTLRRRGAGTSFAGLRDYAVGDDPRRVDWKATARRGKLTSREYTVEQGQTVLIAVDAGRLMTQLAGELSRFEHALSAALVLADVAIGSGDEVGLLLFDDEVRAFVPPSRGRGALQAIRDALVPARATMAEPDYAAAFRTLAARHRKRSLLVVFTDVIDVRASQSLIAHAVRGAARHLPLVVALRNDALVAAAEPASDSSAADVYAAAAAEELLLARAGALHAMRKAGVSVVDVSPTSMSAAVINRYLELKARSAL